MRLLVNLAERDVERLDDVAAAAHGSRASVIRALIDGLDLPAVRRRVMSAEHVAHGGRRSGAGRPSSTARDRTGVEAAR